MTVEEILATYSFPGKVCSCCGVEKPEVDFYPYSASNVSKRMTICKACHLADCKARKRVKRAQAGEGYSLVEHLNNF